MIKPEKGSLDGFLAGSLPAIRTILSQIFLTTLLVIIIVVLIVSDFCMLHMLPQHTKNAYCLEMASLSFATVKLY